MTFGDP